MYASIFREETTFAIVDHHDEDLSPPMHFKHVTHYAFLESSKVVGDPNFDFLTGTEELVKYSFIAALSERGKEHITISAKMNQGRLIVKKRKISVVTECPPNIKLHEF